MSDEQLMITTFTKAYNKYIYDEMVIGQLAHTELKDGVRHGAEVDVIMPAMVNLFDYTGGVSKNLNMKDYMPEKNFNTRYKGLIWCRSTES